MSAEQQKPRAILIGAILSIISSVIAICPLTFDFFFGAYVQDREFGQRMINVVAVRLILILLIIIFGVIFLVRNKPSNILAGALLLSILLSIGLPFAFNNSQSIGGLFASVFLIMALIGGVVITLDSFTRKKPEK